MVQNEVHHPFLPFAIIGAGAWGTALAVHLASKGQEVFLWAYKAEQAREMEKARINPRYLPGIIFPPTIKCFDNFQDVLSKVQDVLIVVPSIFFRTTLLKMQFFLKKSQRLILASKGIDSEKNQLFHEVVMEVLGHKEIAVLSGPSFAKEVAMNLPTAVSIASENKDFSEELLMRFQTKIFRVDLTNDVIGTQLGGALKNIVAIAVGIIEGLRLGSNLAAAIVTYGLSEMVQLGLKLGAKPETFLGLSGIGDLVLTCTDNQSRNRQLGLALGSGHTIDEAKQCVGTAEGYVAARNVYGLLKKRKILAPLCQSVYSILYEEKDPSVLLDTVFKK